MSEPFDPESVVDRVALAIASEDGLGSPIGYFPSGAPMIDGEWDYFMPEQREAWRRMARAALGVIAASPAIGSSHRLDAINPDPDRTHEPASTVPEVERLRAALEPFAAAGRLWLTANETDACPVFCDVWTKEIADRANVSDPEFTVSDFRQAALALSTLPVRPQEGEGKQELRSSSADLGGDGFMAATENEEGH